MKNIWVFLFLASACLQAQVTITNRVLPAVGDSYTYHVDSVFSNAGVLTGPGGNQNWDLKSLTETNTRNEVWLDPSNSRFAASFPTANAIQRTQVRETFFRITANRIEELGFANAGPGGGGPFGGLNLPTVYPRAVIIFSTPADYQDGLSYNTESNIAVPASFLPDSLLNQLPPGFKPDSFRVRTRVSVDKNYDAWGKIDLPARSWDVLREKRITNTQISFEAKLGFLGWQDITAIAGPILGIPSLSGTATSYFFYSNNSKGFIAAIATDTLGRVTSVQYKPNASEVATREIGFEDYFQLRSNLVGNELELIASDVPQTDWELSIINSAGQKVYNQKAFIQEHSSKLIDIREFPQGQYVLVLSRIGLDPIHKHFVKM
jgi:hypothetical protein